MSLPLVDLIHTIPVSPKDNNQVIFVGKMKKKYCQVAPMRGIGSRSRRFTLEVTDANRYTTSDCFRRNLEELKHATVAQNEVNLSTGRAT